MMTMGFDIGTRFVKACIVEDYDIAGYAIADAGGDIQKKIKEVSMSALKKTGISKWKVKSRIATGYGAHLVRKAHVTKEGPCIVKAAHYLNKNIRTVIDTGALFINVATINNKGNIDDYCQNEKCAAGSGKFLEILSQAMGIPVSDISQCALKSKSPYSLTNSCAVFCESEVITQMNAGTDTSDIVAGIIHAIAAKIETLMNKVNAKDDIAIIGGVAKIDAFKTILESRLNRKMVTLPIDHQIAAAYGAALLGMN